MEDIWQTDDSDKRESVPLAEEAKKNGLNKGDVEEDKFVLNEETSITEENEKKGRQKVPYSTRLVYGIDDRPPFHIALICAFQVMLPYSEEGGIIYTQGRVNYFFP